MINSVQFKQNPYDKPCNLFVMLWSHSQKMVRYNRLDYRVPLVSLYTDHCIAEINTTKNFAVINARILYCWRFQCHSCRLGHASHEHRGRNILKIAARAATFRHHGYEETVPEIGLWGIVSQISDWHVEWDYAPSND